MALSCPPTAQHPPLVGTHVPSSWRNAREGSCPQLSPKNNLTNLFLSPQSRTLFFFFHLKQTYDFICDEKSKHLFLATRGLTDNFDSEHTGGFPLPCFLRSASVITCSVCWARLHLAQDFIRNRKSYLNYKCMGFITESIT